MKYTIKKRELEIIINLFNSFSQVHTLEELLDKIIDSSRILANCDAGTIYIKNDEDMLEFAHSKSYFLSNKYGEDVVQEIFKPFQLKIDENSIAGYCGLTKKIVNISDIKRLGNLVQFKYNDYWDKKYGYNTISILTVPLINNQNDLIGVLQLINAKDNITKEIIPFSQRVEYIIDMISIQSAIAIYNFQLTTKLYISQVETIMKLGIASEYKDKETYNHLRRMSEYSKLLAFKIKGSQSYAENVRLASMMHDIGKIGIPDSVLLKPSSLDETEKKTMQKHTIYGAMILKDSEAFVLQLAARIALTHHEKWDGTGYPLGLKGENIPLEGRIVALADVFDALSSKRVYKEAMDIEECKSFLLKEKGKHFDPNLVDLFIEMLPQILEIRDRYSSEENIMPEIFTIGDIIVDLSSI
ncbi:MAG TPA: HD domain-containing protein [Exilispira sp.]|nr:HD domain-containing protein [Exilispira sp.]